MPIHEGGCLCGEIRYRTTAEPVKVTVCHCTFCQRFTGSAFLVEPIFLRQDVAVTGGQPQVYAHRSDGSGRQVTLNFCARCGTPLFLDFERFPEVLGLCGGTFDDPSWFDRGGARHIFTRSAQPGVALPPDVEIYLEHWMQLDGAPNAPRVLSAATLATELD
jgi:hypothetical protein